MLFQFFLILFCTAAGALAGFAWSQLGLVEQTDTTNETLQDIMDTLQQLNERLLGVETTLNKIAAESAANVTELALLREQIKNTPLPADALATLGRIEARAQAIDELTPDAPAA